MVNIVYRTALIYLYITTTNTAACAAVAAATTVLRISGFCPGLPG